MSRNTFLMVGGSWHGQKIVPCEGEDTFTLQQRIPGDLSVKTETYRRRDDWFAVPAFVLLSMSKEVATLLLGGETKTRGLIK